MPEEMKPGVETSESDVAKKTNIWGTVATILGLVLTLGSMLLPSLGSGTKIGVIAGAIIACAGIAQKTLVSLGYIKSRTDVKVAASIGSEND